MAIWQLYKSFSHEPDVVDPVSSDAGDRLRTNFRRLVDALLDRGVSVKHPAYGAKGDGSTDDTEAINAAITAASTSGNRLYFPPGTYIVSSPIVIPAYVVINGSGKQVQGGGSRTIIKASAGFVGAGILDISRNVAATTGYGCKIEDLCVDGTSVAGVHGIYASTANGGPAAFKITNVWIWACGGSGVYLGAAWSFVLDTVVVSASGSHNFFIGNTGGTGITSTLTNCYAKTTAAGMSGYRILMGRITMIGCNGIDPPINNSNWGTFGQSTASGDGADTAVYAHLIGCNIEDFSVCGIKFKSLSYADFDNCTFVPANGVANNMALQFEGSAPGRWSSTCRIQVPAGWTGTWANGYAIHGTAALPMDFSGLLTGWVDTGAYALAMGRITIGTGDSSVVMNKLNLGSGTTTHTIHGIFHGKATWDPASVASGAFISTTVTVSGATVGMVTSVGFGNITGPVALPAGVILFGTVTATNTVTVTLLNMSGGAVDLGSGTLRAMCHWFL